VIPSVSRCLHNSGQGISSGIPRVLSILCLYCPRSRHPNAFIFLFRGNITTLRLHSLFFLLRWTRGSQLLGKPSSCQERKALFELFLLHCCFFESMVPRKIILAIVLIALVAAAVASSASFGIKPHSKKVHTIPMAPLPQTTQQRCVIPSKIF